jgi:hypothetical protein
MRYPVKIIRLSAIRPELTTYPAGSTGAAATIVNLYSHFSGQGKTLWTTGNEPQ